MRTTVNIDEHLLLRAKDRAEARGTTLGSVLEEALQRLLAARDLPDPPPVRVLHGTGFNPAVNWSSNADVQDFLDEGAPWEKLGK